MYLYHATKFKNLPSIVREGLKTGIDGVIYFTTSEQHSVNWIDMTNIDGDDLLVIRVDTKDLDEDLLDDGNDHDPEFFKGITVKTYSKDIPFDYVDESRIVKYESNWKGNK